MVGFSFALSLFLCLVLSLRIYDRISFPVASTVQWQGVYNWSGTTPEPISVYSIMVCPIESTRALEKSSAAWMQLFSLLVISKPVP